MLLVIDLGNSEVKFGIFLKEELKHRFQVSTDLNKSVDEYDAALASIIKNKNIDISKINGVIISSVVPPLSSVFKKLIKTRLNIDPLFIGPGVKTGLKIKIDHPNELGADLVADAVSVKERYGYPAIIIDLGTANKIIALDKNGHFIGATFTPGVKAGVNALISSTAQLPKVSLVKPSKILGKNTPDSINAGAIYGNYAMLKGLIEMIEAELGYECKRVLTGGAAHLFYEDGNLPSNLIFDENLALHGLRLIYEKNVGKRK